jgi:hypothetical protein
VLAENRFLPASKGAENTKENSRQCFTSSNLTNFLGLIWPLRALSGLTQKGEAWNLLEPFITELNPSRN